MRPLKLEKSQKFYISSFLRRNKSLFKRAVFLIAFSVFLEISIPLITNFYIKRYSFHLEIDKLVFSLSFLLGILVLYLILSFLGIKYEKTFVIHFLNDLRRKWFSFYLNKTIFSLRNEDKSKIITKISYHFSLLQMGIANSLFPAINWIFLAIGLIFCSFFINTTLLFIVLIMIPVNFIIFFLGYIIAKYYVSQDQTLYSRILMFISDTLNEFNLTKLHKKEKRSLDYLDKMVDIDSYFRIHRELWLKYGSRIIFVFIVLIGASIYLIEIYYPFLKIENSAQYIVYGIFFSLMIRLVYLSLRIGLFSFPAKLGAVLCIPEEFIPYDKFLKVYQDIKTITFKTKKTRLSIGASYIKDIEYNFKKGERILIYGKESSGKTCLGFIFSAQATRNMGKTWVVKMNGNRFLYKKWQEKVSNIYLIHPEFQTEAIVLDVLIDKESSYVSQEEIENIFKLINKYPVLDFLVKYKKTISQKISKLAFSFTEKVLIQMFHTLLYPPNILVIDNLLLDINSKRINDMISILDRNLKDTIIICFSTNDNSILKYDKKHFIGNS